MNDQANNTVSPARGLIIGFVVAMVLAVLAVACGYGRDSTASKPEVRQGIIVGVGTIYECFGSVSGTFAFCIIETTDGRRHQVQGRIGEPGERVKFDAENILESY